MYSINMDGKISPHFFVKLLPSDTIILFDTQEIFFFPFFSLFISSVKARWGSRVVGRICEKESPKMLPKPGLPDGIFSYQIPFLRPRNGNFGHILWPFWHFKTIWCKLSPFILYCVHVVYISHFGILHLEKSGNPGPKHFLSRWTYNL
jgi:hypothetical protein